jgi:hypothetical protein
MVAEKTSSHVTYESSQLAGKRTREIGLSNKKHPLPHGVVAALSRPSLVTCEIALFGMGIASTVRKSVVAYSRRGFHTVNGTISLDTVQVVAKHSYQAC